MATRKEKSAAPAVAKLAARQERAESSAAAAATPSGASSQRLLREAAWSRMFGRTEAKNPFSRTR